MALSFQDKVAVVTGGGKGIGRACALRFAQLGARVALISRTENELRKVQKEIVECSDRPALIFSGDVSEETAVIRFFKLINDELGPVDFLVNNAATLHVSELSEHELAAWDHVMAVNVRGAFLCSQQAVRQMKAAKKAGAIVNVGSLEGIRGPEKFKGLGSYIASKYALLGLTESLAVGGREFGIRANLVAPGAVNTEMLHKAAPHLKTNTEPEDIARTITFLCDDEQSRHLSGSVVEILSNRS